MSNGLFVRKAALAACAAVAMAASPATVGVVSATVVTQTGAAGAHGTAANPNGGNGGNASANVSGNTDARNMATATGGAGAGQIHIEFHVYQVCFCQRTFRVSGYYWANK